MVGILGLENIFQLLCQLQSVGSSVWEVSMPRVLGHTEANQEARPKPSDNVQYRHRGGTGRTNTTCFLLFLVEQENWREGGGLIWKKESAK